MAVDVDRVPGKGFGMRVRMRAGEGAWHSHRRHQLLVSGDTALRLELEDGRWFLFPRRAAFIACGTRHRVVVSRAGSLTTVYLAASLLSGAPSCAVMAADPLLLGLCERALRWGPDRRRGAAADRFFAVVADLCAEWVARPEGYRLPRIAEPRLARAADWAAAHLAEASVPAMAARAAMSPRSFARHFATAAGMPAGAFLQSARLLAAMELLGRDRGVTEVGLAVGYESPAAFSHAFSRFTGLAPRLYRAQVVGSAR
jgi:AraC-like DNA-binding protein